MPPPEPPQTPDPSRAPADDVAEAARALGRHWARRAAATEARRDAMLATDADRDAALALLSQAVSDGRLTTEEHGQRTERVLLARTIGMLDDALWGLGGYRRTAHTSVARKVLFWVCLAPLSPFLMIGLGLLLFGTDAGDHVFGAVMLLVLSPGIWALRRWAWPPA